MKLTLFWEKLGFNADQLEAVSVAGETDMLTFFPIW